MRIFFYEKISLILDGGKCKIGIESTVVDLTGKPKILRPGIITKSKLSRFYKIDFLNNIHDDVHLLKTSIEIFQNLINQNIFQK